jgi:hypothetical protein
MRRKARDGSWLRTRLGCRERLRTLFGHGILWSDPKLPGEIVLKRARSVIFGQQLARLPRLHSTLAGPPLEPLRRPLMRFCPGWGTGNPNRNYSPTGHFLSLADRCRGSPERQVVICECGSERTGSCHFFNAAASHPGCRSATSRLCKSVEQKLHAGARRHNPMCRGFARRHGGPDAVCVLAKLALAAAT